MSLLDRGPDEITVYPLIERDDGYGGTQPAPGDPVRIRARVVPAATVENGDAGYLTDDTYRVYARTLPAGPWSHIEWRGHCWTVVGDVQRYSGSRRVAFQTATIRRRTGHVTYTRV